MMNRVSVLRTLPVLALLIALAGCQVTLFQRRSTPPPVTPIPICDPEVETCLEIQTPDEDTVRPKHRRGAVDGPTGTGEGFVEGVDAAAIDKTSEADKKAATSAAAATDEKELGKTIASLGAVAEQGFWLKTPLGGAAREGRVEWADNGNSVKVTLIPKQGEATSGSQISLAAMRALGIPLTALPELIVFAK
jgi:hypothetical protein